MVQIFVYCLINCDINVFDMIINLLEKIEYFWFEKFIKFNFNLCEWLIKKHYKAKLIVLSERKRSRNDYQYINLNTIKFILKIKHNFNQQINKKKLSASFHYLIIKIVK